MSNDGQRRPTVADADDDLDDLDDVLDQFSKPQVPAAAKPTPGPSQPATADTGIDDELSEELMRDLMAGMETLMHDLGGEEAPSATEAEKAEWEKTLKELHHSMAADAAAGPSASSSQQTDDANFQASLRATLDKLRESEAAMKAGDAEAADAGTLAELQELFAALAAGGEGAGDADGDDSQLGGMLEGLMQSLMSKEILYEPLRDLGEKYPAYIEQHKSTLSPEDLTRYQEQSALVSRIVTTFEEPSYSDEDPVRGATILNLMNEMQAKGSPPKEIMGDMPPGWDVGPDGMPKLPENCTIV